MGKKNTAHSSRYERTIPEEDTLPQGHSTKKIDCNYMGFVLGREHSRIKELIQKYPGTTYKVKGGRTIVAGGRKTQLDGLQKEIGLLEQKATEIYGPPVPADGELPEGHTRKQLVVVDCAIGRVIGKAGDNIRKSRETYGPACVSINFDPKTGVMHVWGEDSGVNEVYSVVAQVVEDAKSKKKQAASRRAKVGKKSFDEKMKQFRLVPQGES